MGKFIRTIYTGHWPETDPERQLINLKGCGEACNVEERNETDEQFWADDEQETNETLKKETNVTKIIKSKQSKELCHLCQQNIDDQPLCKNCRKRLKEWIPNGVEEFSFRGRWSNLKTASLFADNISDESLYFCPIGTEDRLMDNRFSNLPKIVNNRPSMSPSDSELDVIDYRKKERIRRMKDTKQRRLLKNVSNIRSEDLVASGGSSRQSVTTCLLMKSSRKPCNKCQPRRHCNINN